MSHKLVIIAMITATSLYATISKDAIKNAVLNYNQLIISSSNKNTAAIDFKDLKNFQKFASKEVAQKLYIWIKSWQENSLYMDAKLLEINFTEIDSNNSKSAIVKTTEKWSYKYIDGKTKKLAWPDSNITYKVRYKIGKKDRGLVIEGIKVLSESY